MVLIEGIETTDEAYIALDANADFVHGYLFGRFQALFADHTECNSALDEVWKEFDTHLGKDWVQHKTALAPYKNAIKNASLLLSAEHSMQEACAVFFELDESRICACAVIVLSCLYLMRRGRLLLRATGRMSG